MSKGSMVDYGVGREAFDKFHIETFGEKRWKKQSRALAQETDLVALQNPFVPPQWIAKELHAIQAEPIDILSSAFTKNLSIYQQPRNDTVDATKLGETAIQLDSEGNIVSRWPAQLPKVGFQPGDVSMDFENGGNTATGPNTFNGMKGRVGYYLLDAASLCAPLILNPQPGERVLDVCAAPGGKSIVMSFLLFARSNLLKHTKAVAFTLNRWKAGGVSINQVTKDMQHVDAGVDVSDDEEESITSRKTQGYVGIWAEQLCGGVPEEYMDSFDSYHMREHSVNEEHVDKFLKVMFDLETQHDGVEPHILAGLRRNNPNFQIKRVQKNQNGLADSIIEESLEEQIDNDLKFEFELQQALKQANLQKVREEQQQRVQVDGILNHDMMKEHQENVKQARLRLQAEQDGVDMVEKVIEKNGHLTDSDSEVVEEEDTAEVVRSKLVLNDVSRLRAQRLQQVIRDYLPMRLMPSVDVINSDASIANTFHSVTHTATGVKKIAKNTKTEGKKLKEESIPSGDFDCLLLDAPCSSDRHVIHAPDQMLTWSIQVTKVQAKRQIALLEAAVKSLKIGGRMVYSTCSLSPFENDGAVNAVIKKLGKDVVKVIKFKLEIGEKTPLGWILLPDQPNCPWGPLYISYLQRIG